MDRQIGLLLPCNVVERADPGDRGSDNSRLLVEVIGDADLEPVADDVTVKLQTAIDSLAASQTSPRRRNAPGGVTLVTAGRFGEWSLRQGNFVPLARCGHHDRVSFVGRVWAEGP